MTSEPPPPMLDRTAPDSGDRAQRAARRTFVLLVAVFVGFCIFCIYRAIVVWPEPRSPRGSARDTGKDAVGAAPQPSGGAQHR